jgi:hypothetical protein
VIYGVNPVTGGSIEELVMPLFDTSPAGSPATFRYQLNASRLDWFQALRLIEQGSKESWSNIEDFSTLESLFRGMYGSISRGWIGLGRVPALILIELLSVRYALCVRARTPPILPLGFCLQRTEVVAAFGRLILAASSLRILSPGVSRRLAAETQ